MDESVREEAITFLNRLVGAPLRYARKSPDTELYEFAFGDLVKDIDLGRVIKAGMQTGLSTAIPQFGAGRGNAVDAFGTALLWAEGSTLIACADVAITNLTKPRSIVSTVPTYAGNGGNGNINIYSACLRMCYICLN